MYNKSLSPQGLFIQNGKTIANLDSSSGIGNFYLKPNGAFYLTHNNIAGICKTFDFKNDGKIKFAIQSGPMLVVDRHIHSAFKKESVH